MTDPEMQEVIVTEPAVDIVQEHREVFRHFAAERERAERFTAAVDSIDELNQALELEKSVIVCQVGNMGPTTVYEFEDEVGAYSERSGIEINGAWYPFVGDRLKVIDGKLVLVNVAAGLGIEVSTNPSVESAAHFIDSSTIDARKFEDLLEGITASPKGKVTTYDNSWF